MIKIDYLILGIIVLLLIFFIYIKYDYKIKVINPSDYVIENDYQIYNKDKINFTNVMFNNIDADPNLINKLIKIREKIKKNLVYGIKKKENLYRVEIYLYSKEITEKDYEKTDYEKFKNDLKIILEEFNSKYNDNIEKIMNSKNIALLSLDIDLQDCSFNNKLHLYENPNIKDEMYNDIYFTHTYDIEKNILEKESFFLRVYNYDHLNLLINKMNLKLETKIKKKYLLKKLEELKKDATNFMFHYKYYNNSIGIYLIKNDYNALLNFLKIYNFKFKDSIKKCNIEKLSFDLVINYDINSGTINGTGFSDFI
jgi:hypothetical protein